MRCSMPQYLIYPDLYTPLGGWQWWYEHCYNDMHQLYGSRVDKTVAYLYRHGLIRA